MMIIPKSLQAIIDSGDLRPLGLRILLYRNKWNTLTNVYEPEETATDITEMVEKHGTLSMSLDVNEIAKYNTNNLTLTLADPHNLFCESERVQTLFPSGYQIYGSKVTVFVENRNNQNDRTPVFNGVIRELPNYKPDNYSVDLRIVSPLEILQDTEANGFSTAYSGDTLLLDSAEEDENPVYKTAQFGVGSVSAVYADGVKLKPVADYKVSQLDEYSLPALIEITNEDYFTAESFKADYYCWQRGKDIKQIVDGVLDLAGWPQNKRDVRQTVFNTQVRNAIPITAALTLEYKGQGSFTYTGNNWFWQNLGENSACGVRHNTFSSNFKITAIPLNQRNNSDNYLFYGLGELNEPVTYTRDPAQFVKNGILITQFYNPAVPANPYAKHWIKCTWRQNNQTIATDTLAEINKYLNGTLTITKIGDDLTVQYHTYEPITRTLPINLNQTANNEFIIGDQSQLTNYSLRQITASGAELARLTLPGFISEPIHAATADSIWNRLKGTLSNEDAQYEAFYSTSANGTTWAAWQQIDLNADLNFTSEYVRFKFQITTSPLNGTTDLNGFQAEYLSSDIVIALVILGDKTVLETLEDLALISGYEFGVDRQGIFFFRPRSISTQPQFTLDDSNIISVSSIQKKLTDFATKITLKFVDNVPVEFYANSGTRPTAVDKYGIQNKDIDKPDFINYDNPELAAAIGPQLLAVYSALPKVLQVKAVLNLTAELGDIVDLKHNRNLTAPDGASAAVKNALLPAYGMACKITGINYDFEKRQITYTLRDVSNPNNEPISEGNAFIYDFPYQYGAEE